MLHIIKRCKDAIRTVLLDITSNNNLSDLSLPHSSFGTQWITR